DFSGSSGTGEFVGINLSTTFNTTGTYTGTGRGIYINPTLTNTTGLTWIAFENVSGQLRFGGVTQDNTKTRLLAIDASTNQVFWVDKTTIGGGYIAELNGLTASTQSFAVGTTGS